MYYVARPLCRNSLLYASQFPLLTSFKCLMKLRCALIYRRFRLYLYVIYFVIRRIIPHIFSISPNPFWLFRYDGEIDVFRLYISQILSFINWGFVVGILYIIYYVIIDCSIIFLFFIVFPIIIRLGNSGASFRISPSEDWSYQFSPFCISLFYL